MDTGWTGARACRIHKAATVQSSVQRDTPLTESFNDNIAIMFGQLLNALGLGWSQSGALLPPPSPGNGGIE
jgi:hypothetical protein